jgi:hypothetical protein
MYHTPHSFRSSSNDYMRADPYAPNNHSDYSYTPCSPSKKPERWATPVTVLDTFDVSHLYRPRSIPTLKVSHTVPDPSYYEIAVRKGEYWPEGILLTADLPYPNFRRPQQRQKSTFDLRLDHTLDAIDRCASRLQEITKALLANFSNVPSPLTPPPDKKSIYVPDKDNSSVDVHKLPGGGVEVHDTPFQVIEHKKSISLLVNPGSATLPALEGAPAHRPVIATTCFDQYFPLYRCIPFPFCSACEGIRINAWISAAINDISDCVIVKKSKCLVAKVVPLTLRHFHPLLLLGTFLKAFYDKFKHLLDRHLLIMETKIVALRPILRLICPPGHPQPSRSFPSLDFSCSAYSSLRSCDVAPDRFSSAASIQKGDSKRSTLVPAFPFRACAQLDRFQGAQISQRAKTLFNSTSYRLCGVCAFPTLMLFNNEPQPIVHCYVLCLAPEKFKFRFKFKLKVFFFVLRGLNF